MFICHEFAGSLCGAAFFQTRQSSPAPVRGGIFKPEGEYLDFLSHKQS